MSIRKHPIAYLALFISLGGTAYAASSLPPRSVGTRALKNGAVTNVKVRPHSLRSNVFAAGTLPQGLHVTVQDLALGPSAEGGPPPAGTPLSINVPCPGGQRAVGGGWDASNAGTTGTVTVSKPYANAVGTGTGWTLTFVPHHDFIGDFVAYAVCAS
jgi:hypothetical protein